MTWCCPVCPSSHPSRIAQMDGFGVVSGRSTARSTDDAVHRGLLMNGDIRLGLHARNLMQWCLISLERLLLSRVRSTWLRASTVACSAWICRSAALPRLVPGVYGRASNYSILVVIRPLVRHLRKLSQELGPRGVRRGSPASVGHKG